VAHSRLVTIVGALVAGTLAVGAAPAVAASAASRSASVIAPVTTLRARPADESVVLSWTYDKPADFDAFEVRRFTPAETPTPDTGTPVYHGGELATTATGLANGTAYQFAIWSVDTSGTTSTPTTVTATPVLYPTTLTIRRSTSALVAGRGVRLSSVLRYRASDGLHRLAGEEVGLYARRSDRTTWALVGTRRSSSTGAVSLLHRPSRTTFYKWVHGRTPFGDASESPRTSVRVSSRLSVELTSVFTGVGSPVQLKGRAAPVRAGQRVQLQRRAGSRWTRVRTTRLTSSGRFAIAYVPRSAGNHDLRIVKLADAVHAASTSRTFHVTATNRTLRPGMSGADVRALQRQLVRLHYDVGSVSGRYGYDTLHAVVPFQKVNRLARDGVVGPVVRARLGMSRVPRMRERRRGWHIEVDLTRQVIMLAKNGAVVRIVDTSSGNGRPYFVDGRRYIANTPTGRFAITRKINGMRVSRLGQLWRPAYFYRGYAIHGSKSVPPQPASHGCLRVTNPAQDRMFTLWRIGTPVWIFRS
jgi:N-acetylmuramoyl-L-alanine amidase